MGDDGTHGVRAWGFGLWSWGLVAGLVLRDKAQAIDRKGELSLVLMK